MSFTIPQEIADRLKLEKNQSALVSDLLRNHFRNVTAEDFDTQIDSLKAQQKIQNETIELRLEELQKRKEEKDKEDEKKLAEEKHRQKIEEMIEKQLEREKKLGLDNVI